MATRRFFVALLVLAACSNDKTQPPPPPMPDAAPPPGQSIATIKFGNTEADVLSTNPQPASFNVLALRDLWFAYTLPSIGDVAVMRIETIMPNGVQYASYMAGYSLDPADHPQVSVPGYSPIDVRPAASKGDRVVMTYGIAVSGTDYMRHPMPGTWQVHVLVDGVTGSDLVANITFTVGP